MRILYSNPSKSEKEQSFFETFLSNIKDLPIERWERGEAPDYILYMSPKRIGLEVTALVLDRPDTETSLAAIRAAQNKCLKMATQLAEQDGLEPLEVKVKFRSDHTPIDMEIAARELFEFVKQKTLEIDDSKFWHYYESGLKYSKLITIHK